MFKRNRKLNLSQTQNRKYMSFYEKHPGMLQKNNISELLQTLNVQTLNELTDLIVPAQIQLDKELLLPNEYSEAAFIEHLNTMANLNECFKNYIGKGYHPCHMPPVIQRNILENPGWYTAYTPYQAEIAQGRLEMLLNFQTLITELCGLPVANASLLDEANAAAEAMALLFTVQKRKKQNSNLFLVDKKTHPQTIEVLKGKAKGLNIELKQVSMDSLPSESAFGILVSYPNTEGKIYKLDKLFETLKALNLKSVFATDLFALTLLEPPGNLGADIIVGNSQRFGVPMGYGGPHAAFFACREEYKRLIPGRIIGISKDRHGKKAYRMALQTREQHIRREKATSNICTAQVLLANLAAAYAIYHGAEGLKTIARKIHQKTVDLALNIDKLRLANRLHDDYFDTLVYKLSPANLQELKTAARQKKLNFRYFDPETVGISLNETTTEGDAEEIFDCFKRLIDSAENASSDYEINRAWHLGCHQRKGAFLQQEVFKIYQTEHEFLRYLKRLENKDLSLAHAMIPLGSCTMKLNATTQMLALSIPNITDIHPFAPLEQVEGYLLMIEKLKTYLKEVTGFADISLQPNSGAQGEYTGLMTIRAYHEDRGENFRNIVLIPSSAHGTNPASAVIAGFKVIIVQCDSAGNIDLADLQKLVAEHDKNVAGLMITYPSTHGIFETHIKTVCETVHKVGGKVYMDGANMNAQICLTQPKLIGADVCHLNLHKTFAIPHGGGGPGVGPIGVTEDLAPYLPDEPAKPKAKAIKPVSAAPFGNASILWISYAYILLMGGKGLKAATQKAILNANYIKKRLENHYEILFQAEGGYVAHEFIIDCRPFKQCGITVEDIAKRLMDYGFHAPTVSFPVPNTMMIEPTESESQAELDRFIAAMISIRSEIRAVEEGQYPCEDNPLKNAPHTAEYVTADEWTHTYSRQVAVYPLPELRERKFWPSVGRIDNAFGDRNLICSCPCTEDYV